VLAWAGLVTAMSLLAGLHGSYIHPRRVRVLADLIAPWLSPSAAVLDVGCGDGLLAREIVRRRPDTTVRGIDVLVRPTAAIDVAPFDGQRIPYGDGAFESVMLVDVLHHTDDPAVLLREAMRAARADVIVKDHTMDSRLAGRILRFMDRAGNERHGVRIPYNYWPTRRWHAAFAELRLETVDWIPDPALYPWPASLVFGRGLHFVSRLRARR
jgi:SAM-dependent methyltransferase